MRTPALSVALSDQHPRLADGAVARRWAGRATLDDIPDAELDRLAADGLRLDLVPERLADRPGGAAGLAQQSGVAAGIRGDAARPARGGHRRLRLRHHRLHGASTTSAATPRWPGCASGSAQRGLRLMLDSSPTTWASITPGSRTIPSTTSPAPSSTSPARRRTTPGSSASSGDLLLAYGRDPYFPGWPDTLQLNYGNPATQEAMIGELLKIAGQCDGVRCDMAMLVLPDVFERTWGIRAAALLARGDPARARAGARLLLHGRGLLGPGMDAAAAGLRLHLRQAAVRPPARRARPAGARAFPRRARLPGQAGPLPGEPRRAAGGRDVPARGPRGRGRHHLPVARAALLPPGAVRGPHETHLAAPRPRRRTSRSTGSCSSSTTGCSPCCGSRPCATASGSCSSARPPGTATGPATASSRSPGKARRTSGCWSR